MPSYIYLGIQVLKGFAGALLVNLEGGFTRALVWYHKREPVRIRYKGELEK